jgi:glycosyltransferase involved in cell wall biosynthesis/peptidoglycan/xylan/chitin deacetylase (PgdA/CDA1 family)
MISYRLYQTIRPVLPLALRLALRRQWAKFRRRAYSGVWPIDEQAGATPPGWPGWPEGKRFAVVLTHDVEGSRGLGQVERLMDLESSRGFRSSFNFVPEGGYRVPEALRRTLEQAGFEVGIHGLQHDGRLYSSKAAFASKAGQIKKYAQDWHASGFRSPLMQHRLAWLHLLSTEYDASTFDTDPFEPEPDGVRTIFPFWVQGPAGSGYVELPYTLVQDHTLFVVLGESNIDIWKQKLDWLADRQGMALINTHPDYMRFEGQLDRDQYPVSHYEEFLDYLSSKYQGQFWHAVARDVSRFCTSAVPVEYRNSRKKICMLAYSNYDTDSRIRRYAETLAQRGDYVEVIAISSQAQALNEEQLGGVTVHRVQRRQHDERNKWMYVWRLLRFVLSSSRLLTRRHRAVAYDLIHVHNIPDFLVYAAWYPKWTGAKIILDIHDVVPELFANKFGSHGTRFYFRLLKKIERWSASFADYVIVANDLWVKTVTSRSVAKEKCSVILNHIDPTVFYRRTRTRNDRRFILLFPGTWQAHQGLDIAIEALAYLKDSVPNAELHLYGGGGGFGAEARLQELANGLGLEGRVRFFHEVSLDEIANVIANADIGVVPKRADSFGNEAYSTKIMEFMSQGVPVVASRTKIDSFYFDDTVVRFFPSGDSRAMADAILEVRENTALRESLVRNGLEYARANNWEHRKGHYLDLVDTLSTEMFGHDVAGPRLGGPL